MSNDPEGIAGYADKPKTFEEHMQELRADNSFKDFKDLVASLPTDNESIGDKKHEQDVAEARDAVLEAFNKNKVNDGGIASCKNRVFKTEGTWGPKYDENPNVFRTSEASVYRITGIDQVADIVNCGHVRSKEGKVKGGHENEVFWSVGGENLNFIDERPILEASVDTVEDGKDGALSLDDLSAIWIFDNESGKRENKLETIKAIKSFMEKGEQISVEELNRKIKDGISLIDISNSF
ncbi:hypothetical protein IKE83_00685, partial [Candidatus Saccharibacteria bacterium]|nr:hypothetical protein [Candidatus Saccharibacteria bacterium]